MARRNVKNPWATDSQYLSYPANAVILEARTWDFAHKLQRRYFHSILTYDGQRATDILESALHGEWGCRKVVPPCLPVGLCSAGPGLFKLLFNYSC